MAKTPDQMTSDTSAYDHDPLRAERVPARDVAPEFLEGLKARGELVAVPEGWDPGKVDLPSHVTWVVYPNGDLERVGFA